MATAFDEVWEREYEGKLAAGGVAMEAAFKEVGMRMWNAAIFETVSNSPGAIALKDNMDERSPVFYFAESSRRIRNLFVEVSK